jgi:hypothetical protein
MKPAAWGAALAACVFASAGAPPEPPHAPGAEPSMTPADWSPFCSNCERDRRALESDLAEEKAAHEALKDAAAVLRESFGYVRIDWVKAALFNAGFYDETAVTIDGYEDVIRSLDYNRLTIEAVKRFQCAFYDRAPDGGCDTSQATGWITFLEARSAICEQGLKARDQTAYLLAEWYAYGRVFEQDLGFAYWLVSHYRDALDKQIKQTTDAAKKDYLLRLHNDARRLLDFVDRLIHQKAKAERLSISETAALHSKDKVYDPKDVCPRGA